MKNRRCESCGSIKSECKCPLPPWRDSLRQCKRPACLNEPLDDFDLCLKHLRNEPDYMRAWLAAGKATNHPLLHTPGFVEAMEYAVYLATKETLANRED